MASKWPDPNTYVGIAARNPAGSNIQVAYSLPPEGGSGFGDLVYATVPLGSVATKVARDWLANELYEPSRRGKIDAACRGTERSPT